MRESSTHIDRDEYTASIITRYPCTPEGYHYVKSQPYHTARDAWDAGYRLSRAFAAAKPHLIYIANYARADYRELILESAS